MITKIKPIIIVFIFLTAITNVSQASGNREVHISATKLAQLSEIKPSPNQKLKYSKLHYLGSTTHYHILAETLTSTEGGRPFDNTFAYKLKRQHLTVENGWDLNLKQQEHWLHVKSCPTASLIKLPAKLTIQHTQRAKQYCIIESRALTPKHQE